MNVSAASAVVTGGASGLGEAAVRALAREGVKVVVVDRNATLSAQVAGAVDGIAVVADVTDEAQVERAVEKAVTLAPPPR